MNRSLFPISVALLLSSLSALSASSTGTETVTFGDFTSSTWRSDDFKGTSSRDWDASGSSFTFTWQTDAGDQIGRIGATFGSGLLGPSIDEMAPICIMSTKAVFTPKTNHWFYWSVYGWTNPTYTYWGNTPKGWNNEFYIVCYADQPRPAFAADKTLTAIGSVDVDGETYDCYKVPRASQSQWWAVRRSNTWTPSVNLTKIFAYWRTKGLANESIVDLGWALEGFPGTAGTLQLSDIHIPNLKTGVSGEAAAPAADPSP